MQTAQLNAIELEDRLPRQFERHVLGTHVLDRGESQEELIKLLARYRDEWFRLAAYAQKKGVFWGGLLARRRSARLPREGAVYASV